MSKPEKGIEKTKYISRQYLKIVHIIEELLVFSTGKQKNKTRFSSRKYKVPKVKFMRQKTHIKHEFYTNPKSASSQLEGRCGKGRSIGPNGLQGLPIGSNGLREIT